MKAIVTVMIAGKLRDFGRITIVLHTQEAGCRAAGGREAALDLYRSR